MIEEVGAVRRPLRRQPDPVTGRVWGTRYACLVVRQELKGMAVVSRHRLRTAAVRAARRLLAKSPALRLAVLTLYGATRTDYLPGDRVDPRDVHWRDPPDPGACSVCCHPFAYGGTPQSLDHVCPVLAGQPLCPQVQSLVVRSAEEPKS